MKNHTKKIVLSLFCSGIALANVAMADSHRHEERVEHREARAERREAHEVFQPRWWHHHYPAHTKFVIVNKHYRYFPYVVSGRSYFTIIFDIPIRFGDVTFKAHIADMIDRAYGAHYVVSYDPEVVRRGSNIYYYYSTVNHRDIVVQVDESNWNRDYEVSMWRE